MNRNQLFVMLTGVLAVLLLGACQTAVPPAEPLFPYSLVSEPSLLPNEPVPLPTGEVVLTLTGDLQNPNQGNMLLLDMETLESIGLVSFNVPDPWQGKHDSYTGVLLADLLAVAGATEATELTITAVDGYAPTIQLSELGDWPVLVATRHRHEQLTPATLGPTRLIFPYGSFPDNAYAEANSVWMIDNIAVR